MHRLMALGISLAVLSLAAAACGGSYATQPTSGSVPSYTSPVGPPGIY